MPLEVKFANSLDILIVAFLVGCLWHPVQKTNGSGRKTKGESAHVNMNVVRVITFIFIIGSCLYHYFNSLGEITI